MKEKLHIIVAGDKGKIFRLLCSRKKLRFITTISAVTLLFLTVTSIYTTSVFTNNRTISAQLADLQEKLRTRNEIIARNKQLNKQQQLQLARKETLERESIEQATTNVEEKENQLLAAVGELNERNEIMAKILKSIGIKLPKSKKESTKNSGGPFIEIPGDEKDDLLYKADKYLKTIQYLPLGKPVKGPITSSFGKRKDPLNRKSAFHTGVDIRGRKGDKIHATADGVVKKACRNGGYGNYVLIDHGNGYTTSFSHMQKYLVRKGEKVLRGQLIGHVGNSGRSTGPHLHYEIALDKKVINPNKFMKVARLKK
jgi:murein DD-endopeptidase MepM/ murein hydrolase activator NlpD